MTDRRDVRVRWAGRESVFEGRTREAAPILLDSNSSEGPSPTEALLMSLGACMALDVKHILEKGRIPVEELDVELSGDRAEEHPRRFTSLRMTVRVVGPAESDLHKVERAVALSRETYCSVFHTLQPDLDVEITTRLG